MADPPRVVEVRRLRGEDAGALFAAITRSRDLHAPWVTPPAGIAELKAVLDETPDVRVSYGILEGAGDLAGVVNLSAIIRGPFQNCFVSYYALRPHEGRGYLRAGLTEIVRRAFTEHDLHRVEANVQPGNVRSARLVQGLGFRFEGRSPRYLKVDGEWREHDHYALTVEEWAANLERRYR